MIFRNRILDKKQLKKLIAWAFTNYGTARTAQMADKLKDLGFRYATRAGISISVEDLRVPPKKRQMLDAAEKEIRRTETRYSRGEITEVERFQKTIDTWNSTSEELKDEVVRNFRTTDPLNSVYMMAFSGARGNLSQVRQLVGMRGLMADPQGQIIDQPIKTNFREGLTVTEYVISCYGARKGLVDTALRTADSGYLTRRLVDVSQDVIVRELDCGTERGVELTSAYIGDREVIPLKDRLLSRLCLEPVVHPETGEILAERNDAFDEDLASKVVKAGVKRVVVRSPLTCEASRSVCQRCYGWSLAHAKMVDLGEAIGIIAAQSIGEPGTQLTMRTFHTGGVFTGEVARQMKAKEAGSVAYTLRTRPYRTRHGDEAMVAEAQGSLEIRYDSGEVEKVSIPQGTTILRRPGDRVDAEEVVAEVPLSGRRSKTVEKATKEVLSDLGGEVCFRGIVQEEKTDRQGNTTRSAQRGGMLWIISGEVYNLPPGAEAVAKNGDRAKPGTILAQTKVVSEHGGIVRLKATPSETRELEILTASVILDRARVRAESTGTGEAYMIEAGTGQLFSLKVTPGTKVQNGQVVAELIDDGYRTTSGGTIKYAGVEVQRKGKAKQGYEVTQGGSLLWIPEETHEVNKDISLLNVEDGQYVEAGTEIVKDIFCQTAGVVEVVQKNDILREISIKPGALHLVDDVETFLNMESAIANPGQEIAGVQVETLSYVEAVQTPEGPAILLRPVQEFPVADEPKVPNQESSDLRLRAVQRLPYKDGERVRSVEGVELLRTQLLLEIGEDAPQLAADIELIPDEEDADTLRLQLVIIESLMIRRDLVSSETHGSTSTEVLVEDGQTIAAGEVVACTRIMCQGTGEVRGIRAGMEAIRRILVVRDEDMFSVTCAASNLLPKPGDFLVAGHEIAPGIFLEESGRVLAAIEERGNAGNGAEGDGSSQIAPAQKRIVLHRARPYRVSPGATLLVEDGALVQRGDTLVLLVFERAKTGDIIQGLPRIEELLEARKPKEACILSRSAGTVQVFSVDDGVAGVKVVEMDGAIAEYEVSPGQSLIVGDGQYVEAGTPLTDGPANPHEILAIHFDSKLPELGTYEAALFAFEKVQSFLVNEVQTVYQSQGIDISDKHIEVIVRQMTSKVKVDDGGDTTMLPGELVELRQAEQVNGAMAITGGAPAQYTPMLLGITKASLNTDSFISAASFQETTRVLTEAAIEGKSDWLRGLKENVIIGRLIPAGTGFNAYEEAFSGFPEPSDTGSLLDEDDMMSSLRDDMISLRDDDETVSLREEGIGLQDDEAGMVDDRSARTYGSDDPSPWNSRAGEGRVSLGDEDEDEDWSPDDGMDDDLDPDEIDDDLDEDGDDEQE